MTSRQEYMVLMKTYPEWFENPPNAAFEILREEEEICRAETTKAADLERQGLPGEWAHVGVVFRDQYVTILRDAVRYPDGSLGTYIRLMAETRGAAGVLVLPVCEGRLLLIRHFRHATRTWHWELPAGGCEGSITTEDQARLELKEEIEATPVRLIYLGPLHNDIGLSAAYLDVFYAEVSSFGRPEVQEGITEVAAVTPEQFEAMVRTHQVTGADTVSAYTLAKAHGLL
jgi:ADP-ribose diphosphatase